MRIYRERSMLVMHFYLVCNMNKIGRVFVFYIFISATTGAVEYISRYKTSTTTTKWKEPTTTLKWKESTTTPRWKESTTTPRWKESTTTKPSWKESTTTNRWKQSTITPRSRELTTKFAYLYNPPSTTTTEKNLIGAKRLKTPFTTTRNKDPITTRIYKEPTTTKWKQPISSKVSASARSASQSSLNRGVVAVASFSGMDSRNGRLSSVNGIKIYPPVGSSMVTKDEKGNFVLNSVDGKIPMPITITKQGDGVSGTIRILPGSVSVSSSASSPSKSSGPVSAVASYNPWPGPIMKPVMDDIYFPPFPTFPTIPDPIFDTRFPDTSFPTKMLDPFPFMRISEPVFDTRIQDPWFNKNIYKRAQPKHDMSISNWFYPSFNPFINYW